MDSHQALHSSYIFFSKLSEIIFILYFPEISRCSMTGQGDIGYKILIYVMYCSLYFYASHARATPCRLLHASSSSVGRQNFAWLSSFHLCREPRGAGRHTQCTGGTNAVCANAHSPTEKGKPTEHQSNLVPTWSFTLGENKQHPSPDPFVKS